MNQAPQKNFFEQRVELITGLMSQYNALREETRQSLGKEHADSYCYALISTPRLISDSHDGLLLCLQQAKDLLASAEELFHGAGETLAGHYDAVVALLSDTAEQGLKRQVSETPSSLPLTRRGLAAEKVIKECLQTTKQMLSPFSGYKHSAKAIGQNLPTQIKHLLALDDERFNVGACANLPDLFRGAKVDLQKLQKLPEEKISAGTALSALEEQYDSMSRALSDLLVIQEEELTAKREPKRKP